MEENDNNPQVQYVYVKKEDGCLSGCLKLGCGFIIAVWILLFFIGCWEGFWSALEEKDETVQYFQVSNGEKTSVIHTGMSKDSVFILLGQPTKFDCDDFRDEITYEYGEYGESRLIIKFKDKKVSSVYKY